MSTVNQSAENTSSEFDEEAKSKLRQLASEKSYATVEVYDLDNKEIRSMKSARTTETHWERAIPLIDGDEEVEYLAKRAYKLAGYEVFRTDRNPRFIQAAQKGEIPEIVVEYLGSSVEKSSDDIGSEDDDELLTAATLFCQTGVPDLFVWNVGAGFRVKDMFFVEVKSENDSLRRTQLEWLMNNSYLKRRVAYVEVKDYE